MKIDLVFLVILVFIVLRSLCYNKKTYEPMTDESYATAIENLSDVATKLQAGGLTVGGGLTINDNLKVKNRDVLAELDAVNNKTSNIVNHLTVAGKVTVIGNGLYANGGFWTDGANDISVAGVGGIRELVARVRELEAKLNL